MMAAKEEKPLKEQKSRKKKSLRDKIKHIRENITVELILITSVVPGALARLATQNLNLDKACRVKNKPTVLESEKILFDIKHVKNTLTVAFEKGPNNRRIKSILVLASIAFIHGPEYGEFTVRYLFTRYRYNWDALKYSFYNTFYICIHILGALISVGIFSRRWKWGDATLGLLSVVSKIVGGLFTGLARNSLDIMYLAVAIEMFNATSLTALRSISSKLVTIDELGKMSSVFHLTEVVTTMVFGPTYSWIYMITLKIDAGIIYYCSTVLTVPPILIFTWFYIQNKNDIQENKNNDDIADKNQEANESNENIMVNSVDLNERSCFI